MQIDRHNYEEYFILYMDNELNPVQRAQVEAFVEKHPDLKEELDLLLQFKLVPDQSLVFEGKESLMSPATKQSGTGIDLTNYEEWLVLYMDNELDSQQQESVRAFIAAHPGVQKEWDILQRTKLQPEEIIFTNKSSLYRKEEKVRTIPAHRGILSFIDKRWRVAAAILLILLAGSTAVIVLNNRNTVTPTEVVKTNVPVQPATDNKQPVVTPQEYESPVNEIAVTKTREEKKAVVKQMTNTAEVKNIAKETLPVNIPVQVKKEEPVVVENNNKPTNNLPQPLNDPKTNAIANNNTIKTDPASNNSLTPVSVTTANVEPSHLVTASVVNDAENGSTGGKKNSLRGLLRKVTRTFEKRTGSDPAEDDDKLLVAGLAFKIK